MLQYSFDHVHISSQDAERSARFYEDNFGARRVNVTENPNGSTSIELDLSGTRLLIIRRPGQGETEHEAAGNRYGLEHFGIMTDDLDASVSALKSAGVRFRDEIRVVPSGLRITFCWGPDGELVELVERKG